MTAAQDIALGSGDQIHRWEIAVDGFWHALTVGQVLHVDCKDDFDKVHIWTLQPATGAGVRERNFVVVGTGQPCPRGLYRGTAVTKGGALVWHLIERDETQGEMA